MGDRFRVRLHTLRILKHQEGGSILVKAGDEPYIVAVGFRSRIKTANSTSVSWKGHLAELADSAKTGAKLAIPSAMGEIDFPNVDRLTKADLLAGKRPEILGSVVIAFESDATPFSEIRKLINKLQGVLADQLKKLVEGGKINTSDPGPSIAAAVKEVQEAIRPTVWEGLKLWLSSWSDPDDLIGVQVRVWSGVDPSLAGLSPIAVMKPETFTLNFSGDSAKYDVDGEVVKLPALDSPRLAGRTPVHAVSRSADKLDLFTSDKAGKVMSAAWEPAFSDGWRGWWHIRSGIVKSGAAVTGVARRKDFLDIFATGTDGFVYTAAWPAPTTWGGWWRIRDLKLPQGAEVNVVSRSTDKLDVFATDTTGRVMSAAWEPAFTDGWRGWWHIQGGKAQPGAPITAVSRSADKLDIFVTGTDGYVYTAAWEPGRGWRGWWRIGNLKVAAATRIAAVSRRADHLDIFAAGADGRVYTAAWQPAFTDGWRGWWRIGDLTLPAGSQVHAVSRSTDKLDVFATDGGGRTCTAAWEPAFSDGWRGWWHIRGGKAAAGAAITAVSRSANKLDVFVTGTDGRVYTAAWEPASSDGWRGWWPIGA
jgi:hypothetical protein